MRRSRSLWWIAILGCSAACAPSYRLPLTAAQLAAAREPAALVAYLAQPGADPALATLAARIPDAALRAAARRRAIRLRIAASPFPEVRDDAPHVEAMMMMELGKNRSRRACSRPPRRASIRTGSRCAVPWSCRTSGSRPRG
jgi:hypothetical protein